MSCHGRYGVATPRTPRESALIAQPLFIAALVGLVVGCDPLVGGQCAQGYEAISGECVPTEAPAVLDGTSQAAGGGGEGGFATTVSVGSAGSEPTGGGACTDPLTACAGFGCVDLQNDISHCGACGVHCPTEMCVDGECIGDPVGHSVIVGMSYVESNAASRRILGNAVFRSLHRPLRILELRGYAPSGLSVAVSAVVASEASVRGRSFESKVVAAQDVATELSLDRFDVLLIHDQAAAPPGALEQVGVQAAASVAQFSLGGGTVVVLATHSGTGEMCELLGALGIFDCDGFVGATGSVIQNDLPTDTVGNGVPSELIGPSATSGVLVHGAPKGAWVLRSGADPVVIHLTTAP